MDSHLKDHLIYLIKFMILLVLERGGPFSYTIILLTFGILMPYPLICLAFYEFSVIPSPCAILANWGDTLSMISGSLGRIGVAGPRSGNLELLKISIRLLMLVRGRNIQGITAEVHEVPLNSDVLTFSANTLHG